YLSRLRGRSGRPSLASKKSSLPLSRVRARAQLCPRQAAARRQRAGPFQQSPGRPRRRPATWKELLMSQSRIRKTNKFSPRFEALEERALLAVSFMESAGVLTIKGDAGVNNVTITDNGGTAAGSIQATAADGGGPYSSTGPISRIVIDTGKGSDIVQYN